MLTTMDIRKYALDESKKDPSGNNKRKAGELNPPAGETQIFWHETLM